MILKMLEFILSSLGKHAFFKFRARENQPHAFPDSLSLVRWWFSTLLGIRNTEPENCPQLTTQQVISIPSEIMNIDNSRVLE